MRILLAVFGLLASSLAALADVQSVETSLIDNKGTEIGTATISGGANATVIRLKLKAKALSPGWHGMHLHAVGTCADHARFADSKGHVNHGGKPHGMLNPKGPDDGDLANIFANADGSANAELTTPTLLKTLQDADGSAIVIHANVDDHTTQPIGGAGARVACGVIK
ncbi:MAG: superoxide dismutase family protein [Hyphomicrobiaceae bacterium]